MGALLLPALARNHDRRPPLLLALMMQLIGFIGLIYLPQTLPWLWVLLSDWGWAAHSRCARCWLDHLHQPAAAGRLVAFMQGVGFLLAGVTPYLSGLLRDYSGGFVLDWQIHALLVVVLIVITGASIRTATGGRSPNNISVIAAPYSDVAFTSGR